MNKNTIFGIVMSSIRIGCGFRLLEIAPPRSLLFVVSGALLMFSGVQFMVPLVFDSINDWNVRKLTKKDALQKDGE